MPHLKFALIGLTTSLLLGCGGGGGGGAGIEKSSSSGNTDANKELVFEFSDSPREPSVFNLAAFSEDQENQFSPGDIISLTWNTDVYYDDLSVPGFDETFPYTASVYLSEDGAFQVEDDVELFSVQCVFPSSEQTACGQFASFRCDYAPDNRHELVCSSLPAGRERGLESHVVDITEFLNVIPKTAELLIVACLDNEPEKCDSHQLSLQLN